MPSNRLKPVRPMAPPMRAIGFERHGGPEVLQRLDAPRPEPGPGEVRVRVEACALNHLDIFVRAGWPGLELALPHWSGSDIAGVVDAVGPGVDPARVGAPVVVDPVVNCGHCAACTRGDASLCDTFHLTGEHVRGGLAEHVVVRERNALPRPSGVDAVTAAAVPVTFMTAWRGLVTRAGVGPGARVLVLGAGGGLATACIQVAKLQGATVLATTSSPQKAERARALGADVVVDYRQDPKWSKAVFEATGRRGVDVVVDSVGGATWIDSLRAARRGGTILVPGATTGDADRAGLHHIFWKQLSVLGSTMGSSADLRTVLDHVAAGRLRPVVDRVFTLDEGLDAFAYLEKGEQFGKVVLTP